MCLLIWTTLQLNVSNNSAFSTGDLRQWISLGLILKMINAQEIVIWPCSASHKDTDFWCAACLPGVWGEEQLLSFQVDKVTWRELQSCLYWEGTEKQAPGQGATAAQSSLPVRLLMFSFPVRSRTFETPTNEMIWYLSFSKWSAFWTSLDFFKCYPGWAFYIFYSSL